MPRQASCPACAAPVSSRAVMCALCDHVLDAPRMAAATRAADRRSSHSMRALHSWGNVLRPLAWIAGIVGALVLVTAVAFSAVASKVERDAAARWGSAASAHYATLQRSW